MNPSDLPKYKKKRDNARNQLSKAINELCAEFGLNRFEVTHSIIDKAFINAESYGTDTTLTPGLAETYFDHTIRVAEAAKAQEGSEPAPAKPTLKQTWTKLKATPKWALQDAEKAIHDSFVATDLPPAWTTVDKSSTAVTEDDLYSAAKKAKSLYYKDDEWVPLTPTLHTEDWLGKFNKPKMVVGGLIAVKTVEHYGYELPPGYDWVLTPWGGEYRLVKLTPEEPVMYALKNMAGLPVQVPMGQYLSKSWMQQYDVWDLNLPSGVKWTGPGPTLPSGDSSWALIYAGQDKPPMHEPLDVNLPEPAKPFPGYPISGHWCGSKDCLDITLSPGQAAQFSGAYLASKGLKKSDLQKYVPKGLIVTIYENKDMVAVENPSE